MPRTRYVRTPDGVDLAYRIFDGGPADLMWVDAYVSAMEVFSEWPGSRQLYEGFSSFSRFVQFDGRGTGLSGRVGSPPDLETRARDIGTIMDAAHLDRASLVALGDGGAVAAMFAATFPERVDALVLYHPAVRTAWAEDYPWGARPDEMISAAGAAWALWNAEDPSPQQMTSVSGNVGPHAEDPAFRRWFAKCMRYIMTPAEFEAFDRVWLETDVRHILPSVHAPTAVLHRREDPEMAGYHESLAAAIPGAARLELPGPSYFIPMIGDIDALVDAVAAFLGLSRPAPDPDRILASVLFTDIVGSTERAAALGDARWRELVVEHERRSREVLERHRGVFEHTTGDGIMARFDGPARAVRCAQEIGVALRDLDLQIRAGVHTGEIELTETGAQGLAVHLAARVAALGGAGEVWTSSTVKDLTAGSGLTFEDAGEHELKGVPDRWRLYRVVS